LLQKVAREPALQNDCVSVVECPQNIVSHLHLAKTDLLYSADSIIAELLVKRVNAQTAGVYTDTDELSSECVDLA